MDKFAAMRVFVKIAEAGSLSAAGRQLGLSLNSVSRQLIALEEMLGTTLVERTTRVRIASLFSLFSFAIFLNSTKRIFPDSGVPYPLVSTVGFAIFAISARLAEFP